MISMHVSDLDIQRYIFDKANCTDHIIEHMDLCPGCKAKADTYRFLFSEINLQTKPAFDFDLPGVVLQRIAHQKPAFATNSPLVWLLAAISIGSIIVTNYLFGKYLVSMFAGISSMTMFLLITTATMLLIFYGSEMFRKYKRLMETLDL